MGLCLVLAAAASSCGGPYPGYPECAGRIFWVLENWRRYSKFRAGGVDGSRCSVQKYLNEKEGPYCPAVGKATGGLIELSGGNDNSAKNLKACTGECDNDGQCAPGLKCFQRRNGEQIPGCKGPGGGKDWDYCYDPNRSSVPSPVVPAPPSPVVPAPPSGSGKTFRLLSYNLYGWNALGRNAGKKWPPMKALIKSVNPDIFGAQEAGGSAVSAGKIGRAAGLAMVPGKKHGVAIFYKAKTMRLVNHGSFNLNERDQWGQRIALWAKFTHKASGKPVTYISTHFCVCSEKLLEGSAKTAWNFIRSVSGAVILSGDLNTFTSGRLPAAAKYLIGKGMTDDLAKFGQTEPTFGRAARVDWIFSKGITATGAKRMEQTRPASSDHNAVWAQFSL